MNFHNIIQRTAYFLKGDKTLTYYDQLVKNMYLSRYEMIELQNRLIRKLIDHAYYHTRYYRELMDSLCIKPEDISCKEDLRKLPILTKTKIRQNIEKLKSDDRYGTQLFEETSSGSTGCQALIYKSPYYEQMSNAGILRSFYMIGWGTSDKSFWLWSNIYYKKNFWQRVVSRIGCILNRIIVINATSFRENDLTEYVKRIEKFKPKALIGASEVILKFANYMLEHNINLPSIQIVVCTITQLKERDLIKKAFNSPVYNFYSARECYSIAIESEENILRVADDCFALNIYEKGEFIVTALHSYGFPLINYQIGDYGEQLDKPEKIVPDTMPFSEVSLSIGRVSDLFITKDNRYIYASVFATLFAKNKLNAKEQQLVQTGYDTFIVNYIPDVDFNKNYTAIVTKLIQELIGYDIHVRFNEVDEIPREKSGKRLLVKRTFLLEKTPNVPGSN